MTAPKDLVQQQKSPRFDGLKWLLVVLVVVGGIVANYVYSTVPAAIRAAIGIVLFIIVIAIAGYTAKGRAAWGFIKSARTELRKVIWPTRQETVQTTLVVVAMVTVTAFILWGLDAFFMWALGWLTGQRG